MKLKIITSPLVLFLLAIQINSLAQKAVNPNATQEARALLDFIHSISGRYTLTGQHNYPDTRDKNTQFAARYIGQTPAIWSSDMGFAAAGDKDSYLARPDIVKEAIRQHKNGSIITLCWHAVPPTADEPVVFRSSAPDASGKLNSIQGQLSNEQFRDVLTPGTELYKKWCQQVDTVAVYLKKLQDAKVPVLWRPYHEMNGDWFWWGGRVGEYSTVDLYKQLFDRYVNFHHLNNLVWVWNVDRPSTPIRKFSNFYPGNDYLDILSLDVYGSDFKQDYYDSLMVLSEGKPLLFGEVGNPPRPEILDAQPNWTSWVIWAGMVRNLTKKQHHILVNDPRILSKEDPAYWKVMKKYRKTCGLPELPLKNIHPLDFSGEWIFIEEDSNVGGSGTGNIPYRMRVAQDNELLSVKKYYMVEYDDDRSTEEEIDISGASVKSMEWGSPEIVKVVWEKDPAAMNINSTVTFTRNGNTSEMKSREEWKLSENGDKLTIHKESVNFRGGMEITDLEFKKHPQ